MKKRRGRRVEHPNQRAFVRRRRQARAIKRQRQVRQLAVVRGNELRRTEIEQLNSNLAFVQTRARHHGGALRRGQSAQPGRVGARVELAQNFQIAE